jgi:hypothetical protein
LHVRCTYEHSIGHHPTALVATSMAEDTNKNNTPWDRTKERKNELQYQDVSTYLRAWYKGKKTIPP